MKNLSIPQVFDIWKPKSKMSCYKSKRLAVLVFLLAKRIIIIYIKTLIEGNCDFQWIDMFCFAFSKVDFFRSVSFYDKMWMQKHALPQANLKNGKKSDKWINKQKNPNKNNVQTAEFISFGKYKTVSCLTYCLYCLECLRAYLSKDMREIPCSCSVS